MSLDFPYYGICCRAWSAESRTENFILIGHLVAEILDKVWEIGNSGNNFLFIFFTFSIYMHKIENKSLWKDEKSYGGGTWYMDGTLEELKN